MQEQDYSFLETFPFWEHLSNDEKNLLMQNIVLMKYPKGYNIHNGSEGCAGLMYIKTGSLRAISFRRMAEKSPCIGSMKAMYVFFLRPAFWMKSPLMYLWIRNPPVKSTR